MQKKSFSGHKSMTWKTNISTSLTAPYRFFRYGVSILSAEIETSLESCLGTYRKNVEFPYYKHLLILATLWYLLPLDFVLKVYYSSKPAQ